VSIEPREPITVENRVKTGVSRPFCRKSAQVTDLALP